MVQSLNDIYNYGLVLTLISPSDPRNMHHNSGRPAALQYPWGINKNFIHDLCPCHFFRLTAKRPRRTSIVVGQTPIQIYGYRGSLPSTQIKPF